MKRNGFTIIELIAIISILALLIILVVPPLTDSSSGIREKTYQTKIKSIETAAITYGQDNYKTIIEEGETQEEIYKIYTISVEDLVPKYLAADAKNGEGLIVDPRDTYNYLDEYKVEIKINTNTRKVTADFIDPDEE